MNPKLTFVAASLAMAVTHTVLAVDEKISAESNRHDDASAMEMSPIEVRGAPVKSYVEPVASTGTKTDTPLMETPMAIQVVPQQVLQDQKVISLDQALSNVSGVNAWSGLGTQENYTIRGFYTTTTLRDGVRVSEYSTTGGSTVGGVNMTDVESIEVLKGPAAILYGRVEPGGMVNVIKKQPLEHFYGSVEQLVGSWDHYKTSVDLTGPSNENKTVLFRLNASYDQSNSWIQNDNNKTAFLAPTIEWRLSPQTTLTLEGEYGHNKVKWPMSAVPIDPATNTLVTSLPRNVDLGDNKSTQNTSTTTFKWTHKFNDDWSIKHQIFHTQTTGPASSGYYPYGCDNASPPNCGMYQVNGVWNVVRTLYWGTSSMNTNATILDVTGNFDTAGIKHKLLFGGDYYLSNWSFLGGGNLTGFDTTTVANPSTPSIPLDPTTIPLFSQDDGLQKNWGVYVQDQVKLPGNVTVLAGLRDQFYVTKGSGGGADAFDTAITPRLGVVWQTHDWLSLYASRTGGFGNNNGFDWQAKPLPPENAKQNEIGAKTEFYGGKLTSTLALFDLTKNHIAVNDLAHPNGTGGYFQQTGGAINSRGVEFDIQGEVLPGWDVIASYTYDRAVVVESAPNSGIVVGNYQSDSPVHMANFWSTYKFKQESLLGWKVGGGAKWKGKSFDSSNAYTEPDTVVWNAMASYEFKLSNKKSTFQINIENLFNTVYFNGIYPVPSMYYAQVVYGTPRSASASLKVEF